jgi:hypothetical protein
MCIHYLLYIRPPTTFPNTLSPGQNLFCPPVLQFCRRRNIRDNKKSMVFLLVWDKDSYIGRFLCCFCAYMYYNPNWFISTRPLHYFLVTFP